MNIETIYGFVLDNIKYIMFPEELLKMDMEMSKLELFFLLVVEKNNEITMTKISDEMNLPMSTSTGIADRLTKKGYIIRDRSQSDRRIVVIKLSNEGKKSLEYFSSKIKEFIYLFDEALTEDEKKFLMNLIIKLFNVFRQKSNKIEHEGRDEKPVRKINIE